ncbi:hypothetical protein Nepgr_022497 [Nepenthes gracilis]|uniref:peptidylprolyl isomerase n=1 Tax=Nepenthes gracilis TaxID=150966 RepID=A0AAD3XYH3_NEPGR|nr:hypothetical protein Nepgr_022497 [Nepenthes gracilis]
MGSEGSPRASSQRVTLRLLTSWCDTPWVKMEAIETMIVPTLGTLILVIGANGFTTAASVAGTVASSVKIAASFGAVEAEPFEFQIDIEQVIERLDRAVIVVKTGEVGLLTIAPEYAFCSPGVQHEPKGPHNSTLYYEVKQFEACSILLHVKSSIATTSKVEFHPVHRVTRLNLSTILDRLSDVGCDTKPTTTTAESVDFSLGNKADPFVGSIPQSNRWSLNVQQAVLYVFRVWVALMLVARTAVKLNHQGLDSTGQETQWASAHASTNDGGR